MKSLIAFVFLTFVLAGLFISSVQADTARSNTATVVVLPSNSTTPTTQPFDWLGLFADIAPYVTLAAASLGILYKRWKDRNWQKKYDRVIVTKETI